MVTAAGIFSANILSGGLKLTVQSIYYHNSCITWNLPAINRISSNLVLHLNFVLSRITFIISMYLLDRKQQNKTRLQFTNPLHVDMRHVAFC